MPKLLRFALGLLVAAVVVYVVYTSLHTARYQVEVCVNYQGLSACRAAEGRTQALAQRAALDNACAQVTSGVTGTIGCQDTTPTSVRLLSAPPR